MNKLINWNSALLVLAILMTIPLYYSINGMLYFSDSSNPNHGEGLLVIGYMTLYSSFIWFTYLLVLIISRKDTRRSFKLISLIPFMLMGAVVVYATMNGLPW